MFPRAFFDNIHKVPANPVGASFHAMRFSFNMDSKPESVDFLERRRKPRFICDYPVLIQGDEPGGEAFQVKGRAINLSRNGVNIVVNREISPGMELSLCLALNTQALKLGTSSLVVHGTVMRCELQSEAVYSIAVEFQKYRFV
jgi:PilZ domain